MYYVANSCILLLLEREVKGVECGLGRAVLGLALQTPSPQPCFSPRDRVHCLLAWLYEWSLPDF